MTCYVSSGTLNSTNSTQLRPCHWQGVLTPGVMCGGVMSANHKAHPIYTNHTGVLPRHSTGVVRSLALRRPWISDSVMRCAFLLLLLCPPRKQSLNIALCLSVWIFWIFLSVLCNCVATMQCSYPWCGMHKKATGKLANLVVYKSTTHNLTEN